MTPTDPVPFVAGARPDDLTTLARNPLLARLGARDIGLLWELFDQVAVVRDTWVQREGETGDSMFFLLEGTARVERNRVALPSLGPGDHFGELALIGVRKRPTSILSESAMRLARLSRARFASLAERHPSAALHLLQAIAASLEDQLTLMSDRLGTLLRERSLPRRAEVRIRRGGERIVTGTGESVSALLPARVDGELVVAGLVDRHIVSLSTPLVSDATVAPITTATWEGREIYRRSAGLLLLEAGRRVAPGTVIHLGPAIGSGQVARVDGVADRADLAARLGRAMRTIQGEAAPFREEIWTVEEARSHFADQGWTDAASLLRVWHEPTVTLASCGEVYALRAGPSLPSTRDLGPIDVVAHADGVLLDFGDPVRLHQPSVGGVVVDARTTEVESPRFGGEMERDHRRWLERLAVTSVGSFNDVCVSGRVPDLVRNGEGFHEKRISALADRIAAQRGVRVICVAGPSSSGKTTFIKRLNVQLVIAGVQPVLLSLDDYYVDRARTPRDEAGEYDYEAFEAVDSALLRAHVSRLLAGESVRTARYDFQSGRSTPDAREAIRLEEQDVLLVEGIHGLNPRLFGDDVPREARFGVFLHPATTLSLDRLSRVTSEDVRLLRRIVRDRRHRGATAEETIARWPSVRRGDEVHIYPHRAEADAVFDSSLVYEVSVLKVYAERYLLEVGESHPSYPTADRLRRLIDRFVAIYPDHVPPTSIVREFIGGSGFEY